MLRLRGTSRLIPSRWTAAAELDLQAPWPQDTAFHAVRHAGGEQLAGFNAAGGRGVLISYEAFAPLLATGLVSLFKQQRMPGAVPRPRSGLARPGRRGGSGGRRPDGRRPAHQHPGRVLAVEYRQQWEPGRQHLYTHPVEPNRGHLTLPTGPGLGATPRSAPC
ncbi:hypothetical protein [Streptomyces sp. NPDC056632]|uniref:hypothetical protein n=1 Tax=Streptomyces sp. NPDC056632 TaxID=3345884 RepID=UPI0036D1C313